MAVTVFSIAEKFLGFIYRIFLSRSIGAEGMGLYQISLSIFAALLTLSCSGTPITVSRMITKYRALNESKRQNNVITAGITLTIIIALPITLIMFFGHSWFSFLFADERCIKLFLIVLPCLMFNAVYAVFRGVFWGTKQFLTYSIIELLEEVVMAVLGIILVSNSVSVYDGTEKAIIAVVVSYIFSFTTALTYFLIKGGKFKSPKKELRPLLASSAPVTAMRTANSIINSLVSIILPIRLVASGLTSSEAMSAFGIAFGMSMPLLFIPSTIIGSFTLVLLPEVSENFYRKHLINLKHNIEKAIKMAIIAACIFIPIFFSVGKEIGTLIYSNSISGKYLSYSSFLMLPMGLSMISTSLLNSLGYERKTLIYYIYSAIIMLILIWFTPKFVGIYALILGFSVVFCLTTILNLILINKKSGVKPNYLKFLLLALFILLPCSLLGIMLKRLIINYVGNLLTVIIIAVLLSLCSVALYGVFNMVDVKKLIKRIFSQKLFKHRKKPDSKKHINECNEALPR